MKDYSEYTKNNDESGSQYELREALAVYGKKRLQPREYLDHQLHDTQKYEYYRGEVFAMAGARLSHNIISTNLLVLLGRRLRVSPAGHSTVISGYIFLPILYLLIPIYLLYVVRCSLLITIK